MVDSFATEKLKPGDKNVHQFGKNSGSQSLIIKALAANAKEVEIAESAAKLEAGEGYPLEKGEKLSIEIKGTRQFFYKCNETTDGLIILFLSP